MKLIKVFLVIIMSSAALFAQRADFNQTKMRYGDDVSFMNARTLALGGAGIAGGDVFGAMSLNPALLSNGNGFVRFQTGLNLTKISEDRSFPYYDSFVGFNDYGSYTYNEHWYNRFQGTVVVRPPVSFLKGFTFAAAFQPFKDMQYDYKEEVRDPVNKSDILLGYNSVAQNGFLYQTSVAAAYDIMENLSAGLQVGFLSGEIDSVMNIDPKFDTMLDAARREQLTKEIDGLPLTAALGVRYAYNERLSLGLSARLPYSLSFKNNRMNSSDTVNFKQTLTYPMRLGTGLEYRFVNVLAAKISIDFVYDFWSDFKDNRNSTNFQDTYTIHTGIEHLFFDKIPLRAGFLFGTLRESKDFSRTVLTIGSGFEVNNVKVDIGGGISSMQYYQNDYFADSIYGLGNRSDSDRVDVTQYFLRIDLNYTWGGEK